MEQFKPSAFAVDNNDGEQRVKKSNRMYAFLMESAPMEYITNRECTLERVGGLLDSKGYGIALPVSEYNISYCSIEKLYVYET